MGCYMRVESKGAFIPLASGDALVPFAKQRESTLDKSHLTARLDRLERVILSINPLLGVLLLSTTINLSDELHDGCLISTAIMNGALSYLSIVACANSNKLSKEKERDHYALAFGYYSFWAYSFSDAMGGGSLEDHRYQQSFSLCSILIMMVDACLYRSIQSLCG